VLYAGNPIREPLVHRGPFVAGNARELTQYDMRFQQGELAQLVSGTDDGGAARAAASA
jgi:hypothetical protein